jgi:hypothetical protein
MPIPIKIEVDAEVQLPTTREVCTTTTHVAASISVEPCMPCCRTLLISIAFPNVKLHAVSTCGTAGFWTLAIAIIIVRCVWMIWRDGVKIVVHTPFGTTVVNIELDISTKEIE